MKKLLVGMSFLVTFVSVNVWAAEGDVVTANGKSKFETVGEWFAAAGLRNVEVFRAGVVVGRGRR